VWYADSSCTNSPVVLGFSVDSVIAGPCGGVSGSKTTTATTTETCLVSVNYPAMTVVLYLVTDG